MLDVLNSLQVKNPMGMKALWKVLSSCRILVYESHKGELAFILSANLSN